MFTSIYLNGGPHDVVVAMVALVVMVMLLMLCAKRKKQRSSLNEVQLVSLKYSDDQTTESSPRKSNGSSMDRNNRQVVVETQQRPHSLSNASTPNENRTLPNIPASKTKVAKRHSSPLVSPTAVVTATKQKTSASTYNKHRASPKDRQLPDLPPNGILDESLTATSRTEDEITLEGAYESLEMPPSVTLPTVSNGNATTDTAVLYDVVSDETQEDVDENDLYAQVGERDEINEPEQSNLNTTETEKADESSSNGSLDDVVTYASIDKTKKMSIRRDTNQGGASTSVPTPPPIPVRNFDVDEVTDDSLPLSNGDILQEIDEVNSNDNQDDNNSSVTSVTTSNGPAYDTLCVRESFAHQRLREEVAENQRNRYANMQTTPGLYAQIEEPTPEAVYESVSQPNSADGTVMRPLAMETTPDDDYSSIEAINQSNHSNNIPNNQYSFYENVDPL